MNTKILLYHRIVPDRFMEERHWTCVTVSEFRRQLDLLNRLDFTTITLNDFHLSLTGAVNLPRKPVILTFDDGYLDTYELAYPILRDAGMPAVVFLLGNRSVTSNFWDRGNGIPPASLLHQAHIRELHAAGFEIGSHGMSHAHLTALGDEAARNEIILSKAAIETTIGAPVSSFAYPYGHLSERLKRMVAGAGYSLACGVFTGPCHCGADLYDLRRIPVPGGLSMAGFEMRLLLPLERLQRARQVATEMIHQYRERHMPAASTPRTTGALAAGRLRPEMRSAAVLKILNR